MATTATATATTSSSTSTKKLSGWAQAAARSAPPNVKLAQKKQAEVKEPAPTIIKTEGSTDSNCVPKKKGTASTNNNSHHNNHNHKKHFNRLPYNRNAVRSYMNDLFTHYTDDIRTVSYKSIVGTSKNIPATNWGTVQSKNYKNKNKKYGLLVDIAKVLKH